MAKNQGEPKDRIFHQQSLLVMGILGGMTFTALVFVLQSPDKFQMAIGSLPKDLYFQIIVVIIAIVSSSCVYACFAMLPISGGRFSTKGTRSLFGEVCGSIGIFGFILMLPLMILPLTQIGSLIVVIFEIGCLVGAILTSKWDNNH